MYDIITFGSATQDIHVKSAGFKVLKDKDGFSTGQGICLPFGSKVDIEDLVFTTGGGGTNTAATFAKQGFKTAFCGAIGVDAAGLEIVRELKQLNIDTKFVVKKLGKQTNSSIILAEGGERTILAYRGASEALTPEDIPWRRLKSQWLYFAPLTGSLCEAFSQLALFAKEANIKIAVNPSKQQLNLQENQLKEILQKTDILFLNKEEASYLAKIPFERESEIFSKIDEICSGVWVMTKGGDGVVVSDGKFLYSAKPDPNRKVVDATGAGDSFASGFLSEFIRTEGNIEKSIQYGLANSAANLSEIGAKTGLLENGAEIIRVSVLKQLCSENNLCITK